MPRSTSPRARSGDVGCDPSTGINRIVVLTVEEIHMSRFSRLQVLMASIPMLLFAVPVRAASILFDNREAFLAASTGVTTVDFGTVVPPGQFQFLPTPPGLTLSGINFTIDHPTSNGNLFVIGQGVYYSDIAVLSSQES